MYICQDSTHKKLKQKVGCAFLNSMGVGGGKKIFPSEFWLGTKTHKINIIFVSFHLSPVKLPAARLPPLLRIGWWRIFTEMLSSHRAISYLAVLGAHWERCYHFTEQGRFRLNRSSVHFLLLGRVAIFDQTSKNDLLSNFCAYSK